MEPPKKGLEDYFLTGSSSNLNGIHVQFQRPGWKMAPHKEGKSTWGMGKDLDCPRSCCDSHFDFKEMSFFDLKLAIPIRSYHIYHGLGPFFAGDFLGSCGQVVVDLGLCETCCTDTPCGPAGAFAEYALALAETVAKRDGLSSKDVVGLPLAGHGKGGGEGNCYCHWGFSGWEDHLTEKNQNRQ